MKYLVTKEIQSETKVWKSISLWDLGLIMAGVTIAFLAKNKVHASLEIPFILFTIFNFVCLTMKSNKNPERRNWQSIVIAFQKKDQVYGFCKEIQEQEEREEKWYGRIRKVQQKDETNRLLKVFRKENKRI